MASGAAIVAAGGQIPLAADGGTRVDITTQSVPDGISADDHAAGMASSLDNLASYLER